MFKALDDLRLMMEKDKVSMFRDYLEYDSCIYCMSNLMFSLDMNVYRCMVRKVWNWFYKVWVKVFREKCWKDWWGKWKVGW